LVSIAGDYKVTFNVSGVEPGQFAVFVNGASIPQAIYGSGAGTQQCNGQVIVTLSAGDVLTLQNHFSAAAVTLQTLAGGTQTNVNASVLIEKLN
jgi:BclA C-terminal domain